MENKYASDYFAEHYRKGFASSQRQGRGIMPVIPGRTPLPGHGGKAILADCDALGIVGEPELVLGLYVVGTSRLLDRPLSAIVYGKSSTGKSYTVNEVARLFPPHQVVFATRMTAQAIYHMDSVAHKFFVAGERSRVQNDEAADATAALRQLQSDRRITKQITEKSPEGKHVTREVKVEGPIAYVETTTLQRDRIFPEDLNRALLLGTDESEDQTRQILKRYAEHYGESSRKVDTEAIIDRHRLFQVELEKRAVVIPFADRLMDALPARKVEARRVGPQVLSVIEAVTILFQFSRKPDKQDRLIATADDYAIAKRILTHPLGESLGVKASAAAFYKKLADRYQSKGFSTAEVQKFDPAGERTIRTWLAQLAEHGCVEQVEPGKGPKPATWILNGKTPEETVLPEPEAIGLEGG
jgi:hypothetical protein